MNDIFTFHMVNVLGGRGGSYRATLSPSLQQAPSFSLSRVGKCFGFMIIEGELVLNFWFRCLGYKPISFECLGYGHGLTDVICFGFS